MWISPDPHGRIQAVGTDAAGRRQYRYHDEWRRARDLVKYDRVLTLGAKLGDVRDEIVRRLAEPGLGRDRVLAAAVRSSTSGCSAPGASSTRPATTTRTAPSAWRPCAASTSASSAAPSCSPTRPRATSLEPALRDPLLQCVVGLAAPQGRRRAARTKIKREWWT